MAQKLNNLKLFCKLYKASYNVCWWTVSMVFVQSFLRIFDNSLFIFENFLSRTCLVQKRTFQIEGSEQEAGAWRSGVLSELAVTLDGFLLKLPESHEFVCMALACCNIFPCKLQQVPLQYYFWNLYGMFCDKYGKAWKMVRHTAAKDKMPDSLSSN